MIGRIDDSEVFMARDQLPAITSSITDLTDPTLVRGVRTTTGRIINTKEARRVLGSEQMARINPSERKTLRMGDDDVDLFRTEIVAPSFDRDSIEFQSIGGNAAWFLWAKNTKCKDIFWRDEEDGRDLLTYEVTAALIKATWDSSSTLVMFPLIDYGSFFSMGSGHDVLPVKLRPALRCHRFLDIAFANIGYTIKPRGLLMNEWEKYIIQAPTKKARSISDGSDAIEQLVLADAPSFGGDDAIYSNFDIGATTDLATADDIDWPATANINSFYTKNEDGHVYVDMFQFWIRHEPAGPMPTGGYQFRIHLWDQTDGVELAYWDRPANETPDDEVGDDDWYQFTHQFAPIYVLDGHDIGLRITCLNGAITGADALRPVNQTGVCIVFRETTEYTVDQFLYVPSIAPDWTISQLLIKVMGAARCFAFQTDDIAKEVNVWFYDEYFGIPTEATPTRDWSTRADHTRPPARVVPEKPVAYRLKWAEDTADALLAKYDRITGEPYGSRKYLVTDGYTEEAAIEVLSPATVMVTTFEDVTIPAMHKEDVDTDQEDSYEFKARLLIHDGLVEGNWTYNGGSETEYPRVYFADRGDDAVELAFGNVPQISPTKFNKRYTRRLNHLVSDALKIDLKLRDTEVAQFDHGTPSLVNDGDADDWYHVQEYTQHRMGENAPTSCILLPVYPKELVAPVNPTVSYPSLVPCARNIIVEGALVEEVNGTYFKDHDGESWLFDGGDPGYDVITAYVGDSYVILLDGGLVYFTLTPPPESGPWTGWLDAIDGVTPGPTVTIVC